MVLSLLAWFTLVLIGLFTLMSISKHGIPRGIWLPVALALFSIPTWWERILRSIRVDSRFVVATVVIGWFLFQPARKMNRNNRLTFIDQALILYLLSMVMSYLVWFELRPLTPLDFAATYVFPFVIGRFIFWSREDIIGGCRVFTFVMAFTAIYAIIEAVIHQNVIAVNTNGLTRFLLEFDYVRWGLKRAHANVRHPIYLAVIFSLFLPFAIEACLRGGRNKKMLWIATGLVLAGILVTVSRSGQVVALAVLFATMFYVLPKFRPVLTFLLIGGLGMGVFAKDEIMDMLAKYVGESSAEDSYVMIKGEPYPYNGTTHRVLLYKAYEDAIEQNGLFGWPGDAFGRSMPKDPSTDERFDSIDDHFLFTFLLFGYCGLISMCLFFGSVAFALMRVAFDANKPEHRFAGLLFAGFVATMPVLRGVAMMPDFGWPLFFIAGVSSRLWLMRSEAVQSLSKGWPVSGWPTTTWIDYRSVPPSAPVLQTSYPRI
jgi:hypothetical protein